MMNLNNTWQLEFWKVQISVSTSRENYLQMAAYEISPISSFFHWFSTVFLNFLFSLSKHCSFFDISQKINTLHKRSINTLLTRRRTEYRTARDITVLRNATTIRFSSKMVTLVHWFTVFHQTHRPQCHRKTLYRLTRKTRSQRLV